MEKIQIALRLSPKEKRKLEKYAKKHFTTQTAVIRHLIANL